MRFEDEFDISLVCDLDDCIDDGAEMFISPSACFSKEVSTLENDYAKTSKRMSERGTSGDFKRLLIRGVLAGQSRA